MWINSLNLPKVGYLHSLLDLADGLVILHLEDFIEPGIVMWKWFLHVLSHFTSFQCE